MKTIEELRALHAACLPGKWEPLMTCGRLHVCAPTSNNDVATVAIALEPVASFIATAHNEFPAMLDEIESLRAEVETQRERANSLMETEAKLRKELKGEKQLNEYLGARNVRQQLKFITNCEERLEDLRQAARDVCDNWANTDLANCVRRLAAAIDESHRS